MATPADLDDFALGYALTEGIITQRADVQKTEIVETKAGYEARIWLRAGLGAQNTRQRVRVGPVGCGLCGVDSLTAALPPLPPVTATHRIAAAEIGRVMAALSDGQVMRRTTPALHAAGFWANGTMTLREDVGRHNALDKLAGALLCRGADGTAGAVVMSSRLSVDLVQKCARIGAGLLIGASAPTRLAIASAERAGITLIARARDNGSFDLYTHPHRIIG